MALLLGLSRPELDVQGPATVELRPIAQAAGGVPRTVLLLHQ